MLIEHTKKFSNARERMGKNYEIMSLNMQDRSERNDGEQNLAEDGGTGLGDRTTEHVEIEAASE